MGVFRQALDNVCEELQFLSNKYFEQSWRLFTSQIYGYWKQHFLGAVDDTPSHHRFSTCSTFMTVYVTILSQAFNEHEILV